MKDILVLLGLGSDLSAAYQSCTCDCEDAMKGVNGDSISYSDTIAGFYACIKGSADDGGKGVLGIVKVILEGF